MNRVMMKNPGYDMDKDLTLVSVIPGAGLLLIASPESGVKTLDDFVAFARKSGKVNFGTYSAGSPRTSRSMNSTSSMVSTSNQSTTGAKRRCGRG